MKMRLLALCVALCAFVSEMNATIVIPFRDLGQLAEISQDVVYATVISFEGNEPGQGADYIKNNWNLEIMQSFKGVLQTGQTVNIAGFSGSGSAYVNDVIGDINLEVGETYLFFLSNTDNNLWNVRTLSYYVYKHFREDGTDYFVPVKEALDIHVEGSQDHRLMVIDGNKFSSYLNTSVSTGFTNVWEDNLVAADKELSDFYPELKVAPAHCTFLNDGVTGFRWNIFPAVPMRIYCDTEADTDKANSHTLSGNAITTLSTEYAGLNLINQGVVGVNYVPTCAGGSASGGNFVSYCNAELNAGNNILFIFNDPCSEITDLAACSGTLAVGGTYAFTSTHMHDGIPWRTAVHGYMIMNNGTGGCLTDPDYTTVIIHEATHALCIGHIAGMGTANMNPECCNDITALDEACLDYLYPPVIPVELTKFVGKKVGGGNLLSWSTASELNNEGFDVERKTDGDNFVKIGSVEAQGFSTELQEYQFLDKIDYAGTAHYRLKQMDYDGAFEYSEVIRISSSQTERNLNIYPNPAKNELNVISALEDQSTFIILDMMGREIGHYKGSTKSIDISNFETGLYYVRMESLIGTEVVSFVKI